MDDFGGGYDDYGGGGMDYSGGGMYVSGEGIPMDNFSGGMDVGYGMNYSGDYNQNVGFSGSEVIGGDLNDENEDMGTDTVAYVNEVSDDEPDEIEDNEEDEDGDDDDDEEGDDDDDEDDDSKPPKAPKMKKTKMQKNKPKKSKQNQSQSPTTKQVQTRAVHKPNTTITFKKYHPNEPTVATPVYKRTVPKPAAPKQKMSPLCLALLLCAPFMFVVVLAGGIYTALHFTVLNYSEGDEDGQ